MDFEKLKREWKTFALALVTTLVGLHDSILAYGYDYSPVIPEQYRPFAIPAVGFAFLMLRRYTDPDV